MDSSLYVGRDSSVCIAIRYGLDGFVNQIPIGERFTASVHTAAGARPASCKILTVSISGVQSGRGVVQTIHPHLAPRFKKE